MDGLPAPTCGVDQWVLAELARRQRSGESVTAMLIGIGAEDQALRMAEAGARVLLFSDREPFGHVNIVHQPLAALAEAEAALTLEPFDIILSQRSLSPLRYAEAKATVRRFLQRLKIGGKLFISLYGIHSDLGENYADGGKLVGGNRITREPDDRVDCARLGIGETQPELVGKEDELPLTDNQESNALLQRITTCSTAELQFFVDQLPALRQFKPKR